MTNKLKAFAMGFFGCIAAFALTLGVIAACFWLAFTHPIALCILVIFFVACIAGVISMEDLI